MNTEYHKDVWECLKIDMPELPDRRSRDELVARAKVDAAAQHRVQLWDYFFPVDPKKVGLSLRQDLAGARTEHAEACRANAARLEANAREAGRLAEEWQRAAARLAEESARLERQEGESAAVAWRKALAAGGWTGGGAVLLLLYWGAHEGCFGGFCALMGWGLAVTAVGRLAVARAATSAKAVAHRLSKQLAELGKQVEKEKTRIDGEKKRNWEERSRLEKAGGVEEARLAARVSTLGARLEALLGQVPQPPPDEQVERWLTEDVERLKAEATRRCGQRDRLTRLSECPNPLSILAPASLQRDDILLPPSYRDPKTSGHRFLNAERFVMLPGGQFADFYGIYSIVFILFGEDVFSVFRVVYDFISGRQMGEISKEIHYLDVVAIERRKSYRELKLDDGGIVPMFNVPSLHLSLPSNEVIEVSFPDENYFKGRNVGKMDISRWRSNPSAAAESGFRSVREMIDTAKRSLQNEPGARERLG